MPRTRQVLMWLASLWAFCALCMFYSYHLARGTPEWYATAEVWTPAERQVAASDSDQKFAAAFSFAADVAAAQRRRHRHGPGDPADVIAPRTWTFDELGLYSFVEKWETVAGSGGGRLSHYLRDPQIALRDGELIIAARLNDMGILDNSLISIEFRPTLDSMDRLWPGLSRVYDGRLPIPWVFLAGARDRLKHSMERQLAEGQPNAKITSDGIANRSAATCAWAKLLLAAVTNSSADAIVTLPFDPTNPRDFVPLRLRLLELSDDKITLTLAPLSDEELGRVSHTLKSP